MDVAIIDYRMSNLHSVQAACNKVGLSSVITADANDIMNAKAAILPGVGAFGKAMEHLKVLRLDTCINRFVETGKPFIGICLGLQLLFEQSDEFGCYRGLGIIKGSVRKFHFNKFYKKTFPVPQVGWNRVMQNKLSWGDSLLCNNQSADFMYFVHSYYVQPDEKDVVLAITTYGDQQYCSAIKRDNLFATQFHPEKSGVVGIRIYEQLKNELKGR